MQDLSIALVQSSIHWENAKKNLAQIDSKLVDLKQTTDLLILSEMFTTGFSMHTANIAEPMQGDSHQWLLERAKDHNIAMTGSLAIGEGDRYFNRILFVNPEGKTQHYDKRHLFSISKEHDTYSPGSRRVICIWRGWRICTLVCYDLRFPVWSRNCNDYDLLIYVANWPQKRQQQWRQLLIARAIENQAYVVGVNRLGKDGNNIEYSGGSLIVDPSGEIILDCKSKEGLFHQILPASPLLSYREKFPVLEDRDSFTIEP